MGAPTQRRLVSRAERTIDADPSRVWALVANPERVGEWAGVTVVGYMGTELPKQGQSLFVRSSRWGRLSQTCRVEIEAWDAGTRVRCAIHQETSAPSTEFEIEIRPEVSHDGIATTVRLIQRTDVPGVALAFARWRANRQLNRRLDRIAKVVDR